MRSTRVGELVDFLESVAPLQLQEKYDNSGLLIGSVSNVITGIIISLDCTEAVIDEAISKNCNLIVSHHPERARAVRRAARARPPDTRLPAAHLPRLEQPLGDGRT